MRSRSYLFLALVVGLATISGLLYNRFTFNYGLDVQGGVRFIYRIDPKAAAKLTPEQLASARTNVIGVLSRRVEASLGVVEGTVVRKGSDQFIVELPGFTNVEAARKTLGTSASIKAYFARNIVTQQAQYREYGVGNRDDDPANPQVWFTNRLTGKEIKPGEPEYQRIIDGWGDPILEGGDLKRAMSDQMGGLPIPNMLFTPDGARKMEEWSRRHFNRGEHLALVLDKVVLSIAPVEQNSILKDNVIITGRFTQEYVNNLTNLLNSGALPVDLQVLSSENVDPTIGKNALNQMVVAGAAAFGFIALFLIVYYAFPGFVALIALALYILITLTVLKLIGATFSLAAIAGFILSVGMAVDANILVFERFKEEMKLGKSLQTALDLGFKRALPAIVDSNACTILTSIVLANLGTGPVKGFATTLIIGVAISLFTAVTVTRSLLKFLVGSGVGSNPKWYALERSWFGEKFELTADSKPLPIVNKSKKWFAISVLTIIPGMIAIFMGGLKPSVEFQGGYEVALPVPASVVQSDLQGKLRTTGFEGANVKYGGTDQQRVAYVTVPLKAAQEGESAESVGARVATAAAVTVQGAVPTNYVGPTIQAETIQNAIFGILLSSALIIVYLAFRFGMALGNFVLGLRFGFSAVGALAHDILVVVGVTAIVGLWKNWEVSALFITSMLTVIGFSVHDTIVIFDRIRENLRKPLGAEDFGNLVNRSITQSFARSLNTSMTVIVTLGILLAFGTATPDLKLFCVTMLAGIVSGTYSSIYNASPILYLWDLAAGKKKGDSVTLLGAAKREAAAARITATNVPVGGPDAGSSDGTPRTYGQVKRRASASKKRIEIEEP